jgi:LmbE family N-acetylglucosaminyl deacetylase
MKWLKFVCMIAAMTAMAALGVTTSRAQAQKNVPPDERYKVDILIVVGHPDDDIEVAAYIAKLIEEQHKRVAVVYGTRGNSGGNAAGLEQAKALADVREMEARHSIASYGITDAWFLKNGSDSPGGDVLRSLEIWGHGQSLEEVVRLVRITRPEVILTWMPGYVVGENHEDHQAACVLATEAFDMAGDPLVFPEQLTAPRNRLGINNYGEGLRTWQPKKIYFFSDATNMDFLKGKGPEYKTSDISPSKKVPYSEIAAKAWGFYKTQNDFTDAQLKTFSETPILLVRGKSLVGGTLTGDIFEGITATPIAFHPTVPHDPKNRQPAFELGGPWSFYRMFAVGHDLKEMQGLYTAEAQVAPGDTLWVPLLIRNDTDAEEMVAIQSTLPNGWTQKPTDQSYVVGPHDVYSVQLTIKPNDSDTGNWQNLSWTATADGKQLGTAALRVQVVSNGLPQ